jgi:3-deoxy-manno-octulosonate cytidylyltransferase (CMP-KDO synthetase)
MKIADAVVVATDDDSVASTVREAGAECVLTSDKHSSGTERVAEVAFQARFERYDTIVNVQGDEPFIGAGAVRGAAQLVSSKRFPLGTAASHASVEILDTPSLVKVVVADDGRAMYFSRAPIPYLRDQADRGKLGERVLQHIGVYAYSRDALQKWVSLPAHPLEEIERLEQLRPLAAGIPTGSRNKRSAGRGYLEEDLSAPMRAGIPLCQEHGECRVAQSTDATSRDRRVVSSLEGCGSITRRLLVERGMRVTIMKFEPIERRSGTMSPFQLANLRDRRRAETDLDLGITSDSSIDRWHRPTTHHQPHHLSVITRSGA